MVFPPPPLKYLRAERCEEEKEELEEEEEVGWISRPGLWEEEEVEGDWCVWGGLGVAMPDVEGSGGVEGWVER